jgi:hypothetical protein
LKYWTAVKAWGRLLLAAAGAVLVALALAAGTIATASGATETIGELGRPGTDCKTVGEDSIFLQAYFADTTGTIIEWSFQTGETVPGPSTKLKVVSGGVSGWYTVVGEAAVGAMVPEALNTFDVEIPVSRGDRLGLYTGKPSSGQCFKGDLYSSGEEIHGDVPVGSSAGGSGLKTGYHAPISAVILPPPVLLGISPGVGPSTGGTEVTITGENLRRVKAVSFGSAPAASFSEVDEGELKAIAPASAAGIVDVQVTTAAGTTPIVVGDRFDYSAPAPPTPPGGGGVDGGGSGAGGGAVDGPKVPATTSGPAVCKVPNLKGRKLAAARRAVRAAGCRLGKLRKARGVRASTGTVKSQGRKPGSSVPAGTKVGVRLA